MKLVVAIVSSLLAAACATGEPPQPAQRPTERQQLAFNVDLNSQHLRPATVTREQIQPFSLSDHAFTRRVGQEKRLINVFRGDLLSYIVREVSADTVTFENMSNGDLLRQDHFGNAVAIRAGGGNSWFRFEPPRTLLGPGAQPIITYQPVPSLGWPRETARLDEKKFERICVSGPQLPSEICHDTVMRRFTIITGRGGESGLTLWVDRSNQLVAWLVDGARFQSRIPRVLHFVLGVD